MRIIYERCGLDGVKDKLLWIMPIKCEITTWEEFESSNEKND